MTVLNSPGRIHSAKRQLTKFLYTYFPDAYLYLGPRSGFYRKLPNAYRRIAPAAFRITARQAGFFSHFFQVLGALRFCQENSYDLLVQFDTGPYLDVELGTNWWAYFFQESEFHFSAGRRKCATTPENIAVEHLSLFATFGAALPARIGNRLVRRFIHVAPDVRFDVETFIKEEFRGRTVYGLHYRGTDKMNEEAPRVPYHFVLEKIRECHPDVFFVASDEAEFIEFMLSNYPGRILFTDAVRSINFSAIHLNPTRSDGYCLGRQALIDCLLLSACDLLIRTESNLSNACRFFNPCLQEMNLTNAFTQSVAN